MQETFQVRHGQKILENDQGPLTDPLYLTALASLGASVPAKLVSAPANNSIAVLPFINMSGDAEQEFFTDGLTEDIITDLSNVNGFFVIARNSTFAYKGKPTDVRQIAFDLGVKYILEGSARRAGQRLRINVQLIDASEGGNHIWAERFDRELIDIFEIQDEVTRRIVEAIAGKLNPPAVTERQRPSNLEAYDLCVRSRDLFTHSRLANEEARTRLERAIVLDPNFAEAHWRLAIVQLFSWVYWGEAREPVKRNALISAQRAVQLDGNDSRARWALGYVILHDGRWDEAKAEFDASLQMNPSDADAYAIMSDFDFLTQRPKEGLELVAMAFRLNPHPPGWYYWILGYMQIANGQYEAAVVTLRREETYRTISRRLLAAALIHLGRVEEAREEARFYLATDPSFKISTWVENQPFKNKSDTKFWIDAYRLAGLPE